MTKTILRRGTTLIFGLVLVFVLVAGAVGAQDGDTPVSSDETPAGQSDRKSPEEIQAELKERLQERKAALRLQLSQAEQTLIKSKCKATQVILKRSSSRIQNIRTNRETFYTNLFNRLTLLSQKLEAGEVDTTKLDEQLTELLTKITDFNNNLSQYEQAITDLAEMDCASDPEAYKASLQTARTLRVNVIEAGKAIKTYLRQTIRPTLLEIRQELAGTES